MVDFELRDYVKCIRHARDALADAHRPLTEAQRRELEALTERASSFVGHYDLSELPEDAVIVLDGHAAERESDGGLMIGLGEHRVEVTAGEHRGETSLVVRGGESMHLPIVLRAPAVAVRELRPPSPGGSAPRPIPVEPFLLTLGGLVVVVAGATLSVFGALDYQTVEGAPPGTAWGELRDAYERGPALLGTGLAALAVGLGAATVGTIWLVGQQDESGSVSLTPRSSPSFAGAEMRLRW